MNAGNVHIKDKYGNDLYFGKVGDHWGIPFAGIKDYRQQMHEIRHLELRFDDVLLAGYPKTGTHWNHEIVSMLMHGAPEYVGTQGFGEFLEPFVMGNLTVLPPSKPRALFTHVRPRYLPLQVREKKVKILYLTRNPKDTWVSYYNHAKYFKACPSYDGTWDQFFDLMMEMGYWYGDYFDYMLEWEKEIEDGDLPVMTSKFEDLKANPVEQIEKIDKFLGLNRGRELCEKIAEACKFTNLSAAKNAQVPEDLHLRIWKEDNPGGFFRKGEIGDWKNWFTVAQNERFDADYSKRMAGSKLKFTYT